MMKRLDRIEQRRSKLLAELSALPAEALKATPISGKWSILQNVEHLVLSEDIVLAGVGDLDALRARRRRWKHWVGYLLVAFILRFRIPVRVPASAMKPRGGVSFEALGERWAANHAQIRAYLEAVGPEGYGKAVFRHPVVGPMSVRQSLVLLDIHLSRHLGQIRRVQRQL